MSAAGMIRAALGAAILVLLTAAASVGEDAVRLSDGPADIHEHRYLESAVVATVQAGDQLVVLAREADWVRVLTFPAETGIRRAGWIQRTLLARLTASGGKSKAAAANAKRDGGRSSGAEPPTPVGLGQPAGAGLGGWLQPHGLRASVGFNYQAANVAQAPSTLDDRLLGAAATITTSLAVLDPRILNIDFAGDFQANRATTRSSTLSSFSNATGLQSYRLALGLFTGRSAPLRVWADQVSASSTLEPLGPSIDPLRRTRGAHRGAGFTWDIDGGVLLPKFQVSASTTRQLDRRDYLYGYSSVNEERRAELRMSHDHRRARYDVDYMHSAFVYDVPDAGVRTDTGNDLLLGTLRLVPVGRLSLDFNARMSRYSFGTGANRSLVTGAGADGVARLRMREHLAAIARYAFSNNTAEAAISGKLVPGTPGAISGLAPSQLTAHTLFQDGEVRLEYGSQRVTMAAIVKGIAYGVPVYAAETLAALSTGGGLLRVQQGWHGFTFTAGADASAGTAGSNRGHREPYRELGAELGVARELARTIRFGGSVSTRRVGRLFFYPVNLDGRNVTVRIETMRPGFARLRASMTRFDTLRDVIALDARDIYSGYSFGLSGTRYDLTFDINQTDTRSLLLAADVIGARPDVALLVLSRPELFRNLLAAADRSQVLGLMLRPINGLQVQANARRLDQAYRGLFSYLVRGVQASASWQLRELQLEVGWESFDSATSFGNVRDRRLYVRVRRDVFFF